MPKRLMLEPRRQALFQVSVLLVIAIVTACAAPIGVEKISLQEAQYELSRSVLSTGELSEGARILLRRMDQRKAWEDDPEAVLAFFHSRLALPVDIFTVELRASFLDDVAELTFLRATRTGDRRYYLAAALYAWRYLFPAKGEPRRTSLERGIRLCADIYNRGLTLAFTDPETGEVVLRGGEYELPFGTLQVELDEASLYWGDRKLTHFASLADLRISGLNNRYRLSGLGAPLAARVSGQTNNDDPDLLFSRVRVPVTALLRFKPFGRNFAMGEFEANLSVIAFSDTDSTQVGEEAIPLELEPSAALALQLTESPPWRRELQGFFQGDLAEGRLGIVSLTPYLPGRIPVVLVHGTASSAGRWADLLNDLQSDSVLRRHFQFWLFT